MKKAKKLAIRLEAQAIVVEKLLDSALRGEKMEGDAVLADIEAFVDAQRAKKGKRIKRLRNALDAWCEVIYERSATAES